MNLSFEGVAVKFGAVQALAGVDLDLRPGCTTVMVGPNGAGKSTLISILLGLVRPDAGRITANGSVVCAAGGATQRTFREHLGYLPEAPAFSENLTGRQVLRFFSSARGRTRADVERALGRVNLLPAAGRSVGGYSRGMRQRLGLAVAILSEPEVLVLDEPTGGLDQEGLAVLWTVLDEWRAAGRIVLLSSHELALIERRADQMCVLDRGYVRAIGTPEELRRRSRLPLRVRLDAFDAEAAGRLGHRLATSGRVTVEGRHVGIHVEPDGLLQVLNSLDATGHPLEHLRVEEPGLDEVYQHILQGGAPWDASLAH